MPSRLAASVTVKTRRSPPVDQSSSLQYSSHPPCKREFPSLSVRAAGNRETGQHRGQRCDVPCLDEVSSGANQTYEPGLRAGDSEGKGTGGREVNEHQRRGKQHNEQQSDKTGSDISPGQAADVRVLLYCFKPPFPSGGGCAAASAGRTGSRDVESRIVPMTRPQMCLPGTRSEPGRIRSEVNRR